MIHFLNPKLQGWGNYYRHAVSKATFNKVDNNIFKAIWKWAKRRHPKKNMTYIRRKYFGRVKMENWVFQAKEPYEGGYRLIRLRRVSAIPIRRHAKIKAEANPYNLEYQEYFRKREGARSQIRQILSA